jgi:ferredoxin
MKNITIHWPCGICSEVAVGTEWLVAARKAGLLIPTGCLGGSCGACEIEVNGRMLRACISKVPASRSGELTVELANDPYW